MSTHDKSLWKSRLRAIYSKAPLPIRKIAKPALNLLLENSTKLGIIPGLSYFMPSTRVKYLAESGRLHEAYRLMLKTRPSERKDIGMLRSLGEISMKLGFHEECRRFSKEVLDIDPTDIASVKRLRSIDPEYKIDMKSIRDYLIGEDIIARHASAAELFLNTGMLTDAIDASTRGLELLESKPPASKDISQTGSRLHLCKGHSLLLLHRWEEASQHLQNVEWGTTSYGRAAMLRARLRLENDDPDGAISIIEKQHLQNGRKVGFNVTYFSALLRQNRIAEAHLTYRKRRESKLIAKEFNLTTLPNDLDLRSAKNLEKTALFITEGGPGDEIRFSSIYQDLHSLFHSVSITCDPRLRGLMERTFPHIDFIEVQRLRKDVPGKIHDGRNGVKSALLRNFIADDTVQVGKSKDLVCSVLDALGEVRKNRGDFRKDRIRLAVDSGLSARWRTETKSRTNLQIGLAWRSLLSTPDRDRHYLTAQDLARFEEIEGVDFWIIQAGATDEELKHLSERLTIHVPDIDLKDDFENQAALLANLDAVVSPLTTMAELGGMVDTKTLIFCRTPEVIWRRNSDGTDVWYDNARVVAAEPIQDANGLVNSLVHELAMTRDLLKATKVNQ